MESRIEQSRDRERKMLSLPKIPGFKMERGQSSHGTGKEKCSAYQRYRVSRWKGDRVVTGQGKKNAQLTKDTMQVGFQDGKGIEQSRDRERKMPSLPTRQEAGFIGGWTERGWESEKEIHSYQRYRADGISISKGDRVATGQEKKNNQLTKLDKDTIHHTGGISRWNGDRVVTGQGKKNAQLTKDTGVQDGQVIEQSRDRELKMLSLPTRQEAGFIGGWTERGWESGKEVLSFPKITCRWVFKIGRRQSCHGTGKEKYSAYQQGKRRDSSVDGRRGPADIAETCAEHTLSKRKVIHQKRKRKFRRDQLLRHTLQ